MSASRTARLLAAVALLAAGCQRAGGSAEGFARYVPEPEPARRAVAAALAAWKEGKPAGRIDSAGPEIHVVDSHRKPGQRLARFEILGEVSADHARAFAVRLTMEGAQETQVARFLIVGAGPLWVFRQEDYDMISHWMHSMDEPQPVAAGPK